MANLLITCIQESEGRITHVEVQDNGIQSISKVIAWIDRGHTFYTLEDNKKASVYKKQHPESKRWFLTTNPDDMNENNLDFLPIC
ncbi:MAG: hypothetical protein NPMRTHETA2_2250002 [Nitrosopumilales archaeon]|nr:MAG: hypothetical protein NPMRTHETA2_2250002 [Nitrosopumilales archaeon]